MIALAPVFLILITSISIVIVKLARFKFSYFWLLASCGMLLSWPIAIITLLWLPVEFPMVSLKPGELFTISPTLLLDKYSWPFALALVTFTLAATLTDITHPTQADQPRSSWLDMAGWLALATVGLLVIMAGNLAALILAWTALDFLELVIRLIRSRGEASVEKIVKGFSARLVSLLLAMCAGILVSTSGKSWSWEEITPSASLCLFLAVCVRLGVLPVRLSIPEESTIPRSVRTISNLVPALASLALIPRLVLSGIHPAAYTVLFAWIAVSAVCNGLSWANSNNEMESLPFWISGAAALSLASALHANPTSSLVWGIALVLTGGLIFCFSLRRKWLLLFPIVGALFFSGIPFSPTWQGASLYSTHFDLFTILLLVSHGLLLGGYLRQAYRSRLIESTAERWTWIILPWGLSMLVLIHVFIAWWLLTSTPGASLISLPWKDSWPGFVVLMLAGLYIAWSRSGRMIPNRRLAFLRSVLSLDWLSRILTSLYHFISAFSTHLNTIWEGSAGILLTMLVLTLLLTLLSQILGGG